MSKHKGTRSEIKVREASPGLNQTKDGVEVMCPFCTPPHPLLPGADSPCGTTLKVTAVQSILTSHGSKQQDIRCIKCHQAGGGDMVRYRGGFVHLHDCLPGTKLLAEPPRFSKMARAVFGMPAWMRGGVEKRLGKAQQVKEIDPQGKETGRVLGYFFWKGE